MLFRKREPIGQWQKKSYSQCGEDLIIKFIFDQLEIKSPVYIDIGAHHPFYLSNTALFYEMGWRGLNIEPDPSLYSEFVKYRKKDINLNIGIGYERGYAKFYIISTPTLNTFSKETAENYKNEGDYSITKIIDVVIDKLENIIKENFNNTFPEFLNIDAEGIDDTIIKSIDFNHRYPLVICVETLTFSGTGKGKKDSDLINYLIANGYFVYADTYINTIFVREDRWNENYADNPG